MEDEKHNVVVVFIIATLFWFSIMFGIWLYLERVEEIRTYERRGKAVVDEATKTKMKWHGTDSATCDKGECYFIRQGKKVRM